MSVHLSLCICSYNHLYACVCETEIQPASGTSPLSRSCIIPPRVQDSTLSLTVTHGEAAPSPWRTAGITSLSLFVTLALSPAMPPRWQAEGGGPVTISDRLTGDRWQVKPARQRAPQTLKPSYIPQCGSIMCAEVNVRSHTNAYAASCNTTGMELQGPFGGWNDNISTDLLCIFLNCRGFHAERYIWVKSL